MSVQPRREARIDVLQTEETSLPNALPNTVQHKRHKADFGRTLGLIGVIVVMIALGLFSVLA